MVKKFTISNDSSIYEAWPDVTLLPSGKMICVFTECTHHGDRSYTRLVLTDSADRGCSWTQKRPLTVATHGIPNYNNARISRLKDGRLAIIVDKICSEKRSIDNEQCKVVIYFSSDDGQSWSEEQETPIRGIVPDKLLEIETGRWIIGVHINDQEFGNLYQRLYYSDDMGKTWSEPVIVGRREGLSLCEVSILPLGNNTLVAFMRENSGQGMDCYKSISYDNGEHWSELIRFPLPGCHRPVAGLLNDGNIMITYRFMQGGKGWLGSWTQNLFAALTDQESALALKRNQAATRIMPIDYDRSPKSDLGYSGWVQFPDGEIYIVNYIVDDAFDKGQIRGYAFNQSDFILADTEKPLK
ncbi:MAG: sialidase family protein [Victivallales bacterium]